MVAPLNPWCLVCGGALLTNIIPIWMLTVGGDNVIYGAIYIIQRSLNLLICFLP